MRSIAPPPHVTKGAATAGGGSFLAWVAYTLIQLQTGQAVIESRLSAIERRLPPAQLAAQPRQAPRRPSVP